MRNKKIKNLLVFIVIFTTTACTLPSLVQLGFDSADNAESPNEPEAVLSDDDGPSMDATEEVTRVSVLVPDEVLREDALINIYQTVSPGVVSIQVYTCLLYTSDAADE